MADETPMFRVNGKDYAVPTELTLGEMCDAEQFFGVQFGQTETIGIRMAAAMLWVAIKRVDPSVTVDDIRELPPDVFLELGDVDPPALERADETNGSDETSGNGTSKSSEGQDVIRQMSGSPG